MTECFVLSCVNFNCWFNVKIPTPQLAYNICDALKVRLSQVIGELHPTQNERG